MFTQYFGHYLLNKEWVSASALQEALEKLQTTHLKLGVLSVHAGYMTAAQAEEVNKAQMQMDKRFGEIAIELGYLTDEQLQHLLSSQKGSHLVLGQALVDQGSLTLEQFSEAFRQYQTDHFFSDEQFAAIQKGEIDALISAMLRQEHVTNREWLESYLTLFAKNMIRFLDPQAYMEVKRTPKASDCEWLVSQEIAGVLSMITGFALKEDMLLHLASKYAEEPMEEPDEMAQAAIGEFLNLHNGLFLVNMSDKGIELELKPQHVTRDVQLTASQSQVMITVFVLSGSFELVLSEPLL